MEQLKRELEARQRTHEKLWQAASDPLEAAHHKGQYTAYSDMLDMMSGGPILADIEPWDGLDIDPSAGKAATLEALKAISKVTGLTVNEAISEALTWYIESHGPELETAKEEEKDHDKN